MADADRGRAEAGHHAGAGVAALPCGGEGLGGRTAVVGGAGRAGGAARRCWSGDAGARVGERSPGSVRRRGAGRSGRSPGEGFGSRPRGSGYRVVGTAAGRVRGRAAILGVAPRRAGTDRAGILTGHGRTERSGAGRLRRRAGITRRRAGEAGPAAGAWRGGAGVAGGADSGRAAVAG